MNSYTTFGHPMKVQIHVVTYTRVSGFVEVMIETSKFILGKRLCRIAEQTSRTTVPQKLHTNLG
jgi:hypothetical protein